jgi:hypothetical protein
VAERDPAQAREREHGLDGLGDEREHALRAGVEQERVVVVDQELVEGEPCGPDVGHEGRDAVDALGDLVDGGGHRASVRCVT